MTQMTQDAKAAVPGFVAHMTTFTVDHAEGSWVYGTDGSKWLDFVMGIAVVNTGHCHPRVVAAVREQAGKVIHAQMNEYYQQPMLDLSREAAGHPARRHGPDPLRQLRRRGGGERRQARQGHSSPAGRHRLPQRLPRPHAPGHGAHQLPGALPRPHAAAGAAASSPPATATRTTRRPAWTPPSMRSTTCAASCAPRSTVRTSPASSPSRSRPREASSCRRRVLPGAARDLRRDRRLPDHRRDPGRHGPHRHVVLPRALRRHRRHRHHGQGHRQRACRWPPSSPARRSGTRSLPAPWAAPSAATPSPAPPAWPPSTR